MRTLQEKIDSAKCSVVVIESRKDQLMDQVRVLLENVQLYNYSLDCLEEHIARLEAEQKETGE